MARQTEKEGEIPRGTARAASALWYLYDGSKENDDDGEDDETDDEYCFKFQSILRMRVVECCERRHLPSQ